MATARGWTLPTDGGNANTWGNVLNTTTFPAVDTDVTAVETTANAALPKSGGVMTGRIDTTTATTVVTAKGSVTGSVQLDCALGQFFTVICSGAITLSLINVPTGGFGIIVYITNGVLGVTHPTIASLTTLWAAGTAPTLSAGTDVIGYVVKSATSAPLGVPIALAIA